MVFRPKSFNVAKDEGRNFLAETLVAIRAGDRDVGEVIVFCLFKEYGEV